METNSLIIIIVLGFFALWVVTRNGINGEKFPSGANVRPNLWNQPGPVHFAPALINAKAKADGSPHRVPPWWIPTSPPWEPYASTRSVSRRLQEKSTN